jgi:putative ABC transport system permease protein
VPDEARRALGSDLAARELARSVWVAPFLDNLVQDLRYALRGLLRDRTFAATAVLTLALGIGATTAIFSVVNAALLKPPPYPHPNRILTLALPDSLAHDGQVFHYLKERSRVLQAVAATGAGSGWNLVAGSHAEYVQGLPVSAGYFSVLGVAPRVGRGFTAVVDQPDGPRAVILSDAVWRRVFGARPGAIGESVRLGGVPHAIVGVMPAGFKSTPAADVWTPLQISAQDSGWNTGVVARLRDGAAPEAAARELDGLRPGIRSELRRYATRGLWLHWISFQAAQGRAGRTTLLILLGAVAFLLLIACVPMCPSSMV